MMFDIGIPYYIRGFFVILTIFLLPLVLPVLYSEPKLVAMQPYGPSLGSRQFNIIVDE